MRTIIESEAFANDAKNLPISAHILDELLNPAVLEIARMSHREDRPVQVIDAPFGPRLVAWISFRSRPEVATLLGIAVVFAANRAA